MRLAGDVDLPEPALQPSLNFAYVRAFTGGFPFTGGTVGTH